VALGNAAKDIVIKIKADDSQYQAALKRADTSTASFAKSMSAYGKAAEAALLAATIAAVSFSIKSAASYEQLERGFTSLVDAQGKDADKYVAKLKEATHGAASQASLLQQANQAMLLGIDIDTLVQMAEGASVIAQATGQSTDFLFQSMALGTARQSRLILDNLGIIVDSEKAYQDYADSIGVAVDALTEEQRKIAFTSAAMDGLNTRVESLGGFTEDTNSKMETFNANIADLSANMGEMFLPAVNDALDLLNGTLDELNSVMETLNEWSQTDISMKVDVTSTNASVERGINDWIATMNEKKAAEEKTLQENTEAVKENTAAMSDWTNAGKRRNENFTSTVFRGSEYFTRTDTTDTSTSYTANTSGADT